MMKLNSRRIAGTIAVWIGTLCASSFAYIDWPGAPSPDGYPSDPASRIHHWKEEAIVGNQYITVQLDANGTIYDIYYPSSGFRYGSGTSNEGYHGPEGFVGGPCSGSPCYDCGSAPVGPRLEANGQMNMIAAMGGIQVGSNIYWMKNDAATGPGPAGYDNFTQGYETDNNVLVTSNRLNVSGNMMAIVQYDFCPTTNAIPPVATDGLRTNYGVYVKRYILTNLESSPKIIKFYFDANFNVKGSDAHDAMYMDYDYVVPALGAGQTNHTMVVFDNDNTLANGSGCGPDGYGGTSGTEYNPRTTTSYNKGASVYFGVCMKEVTNTLTGAGTAFDGNWRETGSADNFEGWIGKSVSFAANETKEIDIMIVGSWDDTSGATGTHNFWGRPLVNWFYANSMAAAQATTEADWASWLAQGVRIDFPGSTYDSVFNRSKLATALHIDAKTGSIIAGMHNGAYPFVWPRDGIYAAITLDRLGYPRESENFYRWLRDTAYRAPDSGPPTGKSFFFQKYTTDGYFAWSSPQIDETASVPWGAYYHYLSTGDSAFLNNYWQLVRESAYSSYYTSAYDSRANYNFTYNLMNGNNVWEDSFGLFIYSNASVVRGLREAANFADLMGSSSEASSWRAQAEIIRTNGIIPRVGARTEPADISHLGMAVPYEVFCPTDSVMQAVAEWIHGNGAPAGGFNDNLEETGGGNAGYWRRYNHNISGSIDNYWNGGPWHLSTAWYGEYNLRWQDYVAGKTLADVGKDMLDKIIARLGPVGLGAEQIAPDYAQKYPGFWHQAAWPNVWESHSTFIDLMMMFLDYKPQATNNTCSFAPKLPTGWSTMGFSNMLFQSQRFDVGVTEGVNNVRLDLRKRTAGALNIDTYLRIPAGTDAGTVAAFTNGTYIAAPPYDSTTGRVHIQGPLTVNAANNPILVTYGAYDSVGDGIADAWRRQYFGGDGTTTNAQSCASCDADSDGLSNEQEYLAGTVPTNSASAFRILTVTRDPSGNNIVTYSSVPAKKYVVQFTDDMLLPFADLPGTNTAAGSSASYTNNTAVAARFYRVRLLP
jgi:GH15 family glucan-1,4-alpha-glucosidase